MVKAEFSKSVIVLGFKYKGHVLNYMSHTQEAKY